MTFNNQPPRNPGRFINELRRGSFTFCPLKMLMLGEFLPSQPMVSGISLTNAVSDSHEFSIRYSILM
ncbi:MAG: hypothetical protein WAW41_18025 [Methylobacter sp.]